MRIKPEACTAGNPIQCAGGQKIQIENDIASVGDEPLEFARYYSSAGFYTAPQVEHAAEILGIHWRHSWQGSVTVEAATSANQQTYAYVMFPDGNYRHFGWNGSAWIGRTDKSDSLQEVVSGGHRTGWAYTDEHDAIYRYDADGVWQSVERYGRLTALSYSDSSTPPTVAPKPGLLVAVTSSQGRTLHFNYDQDGYLVRVVDSNGSAFGFRYLMREIVDLPTRNDGLLLHADRPDGSSREYLYDESAFSPSINHTGLLTGVVDEVGNRFATFKYDAQGRALEEWHGSGDADKLTLSYAASYTTQNSSTRIVDGVGSSTRRKFTAVNGILKDVGNQRCGDATCSVVTGQTSRTYDSNGNVDQATDYNGVATDYAHDARGRETQRIEAFSGAGATAVRRTVQTDWHSTLNVPTERRTFGAAAILEAVSRLSYNPRGQSTARCEIDPSDTAAMAYPCSATTAPPVAAKVRRTVTTYCEQADIAAGTCPLIGQVTSVNGPRVNTETGMGGLDDITTYTYYPTDDATCASGGTCRHRHGDLWKVTNALGHVTEYVRYDKNGRIKRIKDANGTFTDFAYHSRGWLTDRIVRASANGTPAQRDATLHLDYDAVGNITKVAQPDAAYLEYTYDDAHRLIAIEDNLGNTIDYCPGGVGSADCLDAAGNRRVEQVNDPSGTVKRQLHRVYNQLGQLTQVLNASSQAVETSAGLAETGVVDGYDGNGNRVLVEDGLGMVTKREYDSLDRLKKTIQNAAGIDLATANTTTAYTYDTRDNLRQVTDPDGLNTVYDYDGINNLTGLHSPDTGDTSYTYDRAGNRISQTDARGITTTYTYDALNRLTGIAYPTAGLDVSYTYDRPDTVTGCSDSFAKGRLTQMGDAAGSTTYCYDRHGNMTRKIHAATKQATLVTHYSYTLADRLASITYPSGALVTYARNLVGRVRAVSWKANALAPPIPLINSTGYAPFGPLTMLAFGNGRTLTKAYDQDYAIDAISGTPAGALTLDLAVDAMGNVTQASDTLAPSTPDRAYQYDPLYRLTTAQSGTTPPAPLAAYTYTPTGDRTSASLNGGPAETYSYTANTHRLASIGATTRSYDANGNTRTGLPSGVTLTYDDRNRLSRATLPLTTALYTHNGRGERVRKLFNNGLFATTTRYGYDEAGQLLGEYDDDGTPKAEYVYLDNTPIAVVRDATPYYIETDHLGTPRQVVKPATNAGVWKWDSLESTFGTNSPDEDPDGDGTAFGLNLRFPGQYFDAETGLNYNYFRDYDALSGRYVESDPLGLHGGRGSYVYVHSNPLISVDPYGLFRWKGTVLAIGADVKNVGALTEIYTLTSECSFGKIYTIRVMAEYAMLGAGFAISYAGSSAEFEDHMIVMPDKSAFIGTAKQWGVSFATGVGFGINGTTQLGQATAVDTFDFLFGLDFGISLLRGSSDVLWEYSTPCKCE